MCRGGMGRVSERRLQMSNANFENCQGFREHPKGRYSRQLGEESKPFTTPLTTVTIPKRQHHSWPENDVVFCTSGVRHASHHNEELCAVGLKRETRLGVGGRGGCHN